MSQPIGTFEPDYTGPWLAGVDEAASFLAMLRAVEGLQREPEHVLVDGNRLPNWHYAAQAVVKGDSRHPAISAASIMAKVARDRDMLAMEAAYPGYGFAEHKGYPTQRHLAALQTLGASPIHRSSYAPVRARMTQIDLL